MSLLIKGIQKTSLIDYPGKVAATIFVGMCSFRCPFCYNKDLVVGYDGLPSIKEKEVIDYIESKRKWFDGVCISGGEPTMHKELPSFIKKIKERGFLVKLDTNGSNPEMLNELINDKLVDYVAMDIKAPLERYDEVVRVKANKKDIQSSVDILKQGRVDYEFRTTAVPGLFSKEDAEKIGQWLKGSKRFFIQQFRPDKKTIDSAYSSKKPFEEDMLKEIRVILKKYISRVEIRSV